MRLGALSAVWRGLSVICLIAILGIGVRVIYLQLRDASGRLNEVAVQELSKSLHREVHVKRVDVLRPGVVEVDGLAISAGKTFKSGTLLDAPRTVVSYRLWDVLRRQVDPVGSIASIDLYDARLLVERDKNNKFNLQNIFPKQTTPPKPTTFRGVAHIHNFRVEYRDYAAHNMSTPQTSYVAADASVDGSGPPLILISATAHGDGSRVGNSNCDGDYNPGSGALRLHIVAGTRALGYWSRYFVSLPNINVTSGSGVATVDVWKPKKFAYLTATVGVDVSDAAAATGYTLIPLTQVGGHVSIRTGQPLSTTLDLTGRAGDVPLRIYGSVFTRPESRVALQIQAENVTLAGLKRIVPNVPAPPMLQPLQPATVNAQVYGPTNDITTLATVRVPSVRIYQSVVSNVTAMVVYRNHVAELPSISGQSDGRSVTANGAVDLRNKTVRLVASVPVVSVAALGLRKLPLTGALSSRLVISGPMSALQTSALVTVKDGTFRGIPFERLAARVSVNGGRINIENAVALLSGSAVTAQGTATTTGGMNVTVHGAGLQLARLLPSMGYRNISGTAFFDGTIAGTLSHPSVSGAMKVFNARAYNEPLDLISGRASWSENRLRVFNTLVARYPSQGIVDGVALLQPNRPPVLDFTAKLTTGRLESLLADAGYADSGALGNVTGAARIRGTMAAPDIRGSLAVTDAAVHGVPVESATSDVHMAKGLWEATNVRILSDTAVATAPYLRMRGNRLSGRFSADSIVLSRFVNLGQPYLQFAGSLNVRDGVVSGTRQHPMASATVDTTDPGLKVNGIVFQKLTAQVQYAGDSAILKRLRLYEGDSPVVEADNFTLDRQTGSIGGDLKIAKLSAGEISLAVEHSPWVQNAPEADDVRTMLTHVQGRVTADIDANVHISGSLNDFSASGAVSLSGADGVHIGGQKFDRASLTGSLTHGVLAEGKLLDAVIDVPADGLEVTYADKSQNIDMLVRGQFRGELAEAIEPGHTKLEMLGVPLSYLRPFLPPNQAKQFGGAITSATITASGPVKSPTLQASVDADVLFGPPSSPERFAVSTEAITVQDGKINVNNIEVTARQQRVEVSGYIPFHWSAVPVPGALPPRYTRIPPTEPIHFVADIKQQDLKLLELISSFAGKGAVRRADGTVQGHIEADGSLAHTALTGSLHLANGNLGLPQLTDDLKNIAVDLHFAGSNVYVDTLHVDSGGSLTAEPGGTVQIGYENGAVAIVPNVTLALKSFRIDETPDALGYGERVRGTADGTVTLTRSYLQPLVAGKLTLTDVEINPPSKEPVAVEAASTSRFAPRFDLTLIAGKNVVLKNPLLRVTVDSRQATSRRQVVVTGGLGDLTVRGTMVSRDGTFTFPTARFTLTNAVVAIHYQSAQSNDSSSAAPFDINADATARVYATINNRREPITLYMHVEGAPTDRTSLVSNTDSQLAGLPYNISLRSSPSLPEQTLISLITREAAISQLAQGGASTQDILRSEALNVLQASVLPAALSGLEDSVSKFFGLENFSLDYIDSDRAVSVSASKRLARHLLFTYTLPVGSNQTGGSTDAYDLSLSYELTPRLRLTLEQQRGPYLIGGIVSAGPTITSPGTQPTVHETAILLEGGFSF